MTARGSAARSPALPGERAGRLTPGVPHQRPWKSRGGWALGPTSQSRTQPLVAPDLSLGSSSITNTSQGHSWSLMLGSLDVDTGLGACPGLPGVKAAGEKGTVPCCWALGTRVPSQAWSSGDSSLGLGLTLSPECLRMPGSPMLICPCTPPGGGQVSGSCAPAPVGLEGSPAEPCSASAAWGWMSSAPWSRLPVSTCPSPLPKPPATAMCPVRPPGLWGTGLR